VTTIKPASGRPTLTSIGKRNGLWNKIEVIKLLSSPKYDGFLAAVPEFYRDRQEAILNSKEGGRNGR
jgi:hypothetical protein